MSETEARSKGRTLDTIEILTLIRIIVEEGRNL